MCFSYSWATSKYISFDTIYQLYLNIYFRIIISLKTGSYDIGTVITKLYIAFYSKKNRKELNFKCFSSLSVSSIKPL